MNPKLILTHGLPGSGKTTAMKKLVEANPETHVRVNRDDTRERLFGAKYLSQTPQRARESQVTQAQEEALRAGFRAGKTVIVDDTNLVARFVSNIVAIARDYGATIEQVHFDVPVKVCIERNRKRGAAGGHEVPAEVIESMARRAYADGHLKEFIIGRSNDVFVVPRVTEGSRLLEAYEKRQKEQFPDLGGPVVFVDLDGTLANNGHDAAYAFGREGEPKDYHYFHTQAEFAPAHSGVLTLIQAMREAGLTIVALSGRSDKYARETIAFLERIGAPVSHIILKRNGDHRPDYDFKEAVYDDFLAAGRVVAHVIEDRPSVVAMWHRRGVAVSPVVHYSEAYNPAVTGPFPEAELQSFFNEGYCIRCGKPIDAPAVIHEDCSNAR